MPPAIRTAGIKELRKAFKELGNEAPKELTKTLKAGAELALPLARQNIRRRTGRLSDSLRATGAGNRAAIRSTVIYGVVVHWRKQEVSSRLFAVRAIDTKADQIVDGINEGIANVARRHGWH